MKKNDQLKIINVLLFVFFVVQMGSGLFKASMSRQVFHTVHEWGYRGLLLFAILHVIYNFGWIKNSFFKRKKTQG